MKFLKKRALARRVVAGYESDATIWRRAREKAGFVSSCLIACSAEGKTRLAGKYAYIDYMYLIASTD
jgi:hypothetical protein